MDGPTFAATYLDPPNGIFYVARTPQRDNGAGWPSKAHYYRGFIADALRRARRNSAGGMDDPTSVARIPQHLTSKINKASTIRDTAGNLIAPNVQTDWIGLTSLGVVPYGGELAPPE